MNQRTPQEIAAALYRMLAGVAKKEGRREHLAAGEQYGCRLDICGDVDDEPVKLNIAGRLDVGHDFTRATGSTPDLVSLLAVVIETALGKVNAQTRKSLMAALDAIPALYKRDGNEFTGVNQEITQFVQSLLSRMRATKQVTVRGGVGCDYALLE